MTVRRSLSLLVALLAAFLGTNLGSAADAAQLYGASGSYGSISPGQVRGTTVNTCSVGTCYQRQLQVPGPTVGKSPSATAAQNVRIQYRVYRWNGSTWAFHTSATRNYSMGYNSAVRLPQMNINVGAGYYWVEETLTWTVASTGTTLGSRSVSFNGYNAYDYACSNSRLSCSTSAGWLYFG